MRLEFGLESRVLAERLALASTDRPLVDAATLLSREPLLGSLVRLCLSLLYLLSLLLISVIAHRCVMCLFTRGSPPASTKAVGRVDRLGTTRGSRPTHRLGVINPLRQFISVNCSYPPQECLTPEKSASQ